MALIRPSCALLALLVAGPALAAGDAVPAPGLAPARARIGFERVRLPGDEALGLVGASVLVDLPAAGWSLGPAVYGAVSGRRGGFYTLGGELAWRRRLAGPLAVEVGLYAGGGGGGGAPQGGGLMLRPHADLWWSTGPGAIGVSLSRVRFPNGRIDSTQLGIAWAADTSFRFAPATGGQAPRDLPELGFDRFVAVAGAYRPSPHATFLDGRTLPASIAWVGFRAERAWGRHAFWGLEANGGASRATAGYAELLGTAGLVWPLDAERLAVGARLAVGTGGGGAVSVGGGLLVKAAVDARLALAPGQAIELEAGWAAAPGGSFRAPYGSLAWSASLDGDGDAAAPVRTEFGAGLASFRAARRDGTSRRLSADLLRVARFRRPASLPPRPGTERARRRRRGLDGGMGRARLAPAARCRLERRGRGIGRRRRGRRRRRERPRPAPGDGLRRPAAVADARGPPRRRSRDGAGRAARQRHRRPVAGVRHRPLSRPGAIVGAAVAASGRALRRA